MSCQGNELEDKYVFQSMKCAYIDIIFLKRNYFWYGRHNGTEVAILEIEDSPSRKITKPVLLPPALPGTPNEIRYHASKTSVRSKRSTVNNATMDRYLEDQYRMSTKKIPPTTFGTCKRFGTGPYASWNNPISVSHNALGSDTDSADDGLENGHRQLWSKLLPIKMATSGMPRSHRHHRSKRRRVVEKSGDPNIQYKNISKRRRKYLSDLFTTLVDSSWIETLLLFATSFYLTWLIFALIYYIICYQHGDLADNLEEGWKPCVLEIEDFASCFLFSLETQHTIGYGTRQTTNECVSAMIAMSLQSVIGCLIQAFMVGLVFAKLSIPKNRAKTVVFSKNAVICERNKKLCMIFRIGDMRHDSFIVNASISVKIIRRRVSDEGEMYHEVNPIKIKPDSAEEPCVFMIWPITVLHVIDEDSPFYNCSATDLAHQRFELHAVLEGVTESTSMTFQARTSYLPREILWGHRFESMMIYRRDNNKYQVNFSAFHSTYEVDTPLCSSSDLDEYYKGQQQHQNFTCEYFLYALS